MSRVPAKWRARCRAINRLILAISLSMLLACDRNDSGDVTYRYAIYPNSTVDINTFTRGDQTWHLYDLRDGDKLVFAYYYELVSSPEILDNDVTEIVLFEIDSNVREFDFSDSSLAGINAVFHNTAAWGDNGSFPIVDGQISGFRQTADSWLVTIDIRFEGQYATYEKDVMAHFTISDQRDEHFNKL